MASYIDKIRGAFQRQYSQPSGSSSSSSSGGRSIDDEKKAGKEALNENPSSLTKMLSDPETAHATSTNEYLAQTLGDKAPQSKQPQTQGLFKKLFGGNDKPTYLTDAQYDEEDRKDSANPLLSQKNLTQQIEKKKSDLAKAEEVAAYAVDADAGSKAAKDVARLKSELNILEQQNNRTEQKPKPIEYSDAFLKQEDMKDSMSPTWYNGEETKVDPKPQVMIGAAEQWLGDTANAFSTAVNALDDISAGRDTTDGAPVRPYGHTADEVRALNDRLAGKVETMGDYWAQDGARRIEEVKSKTGKVGDFLIDLGANATQMGLDAASSLVTGSGLVTLFVRAAGGASREARMDGATSEQQLTYGLTKGGIEAATEKVSDGLSFIYGKGKATDITEALVKKLAKSDAGRTALRVIIGAVGEGNEEAISDLLDPFAKKIYDGGAARAEGYKIADIMYDYLVGATMGFLGGGVNIVTGQDAEANAALREAEQQTAEQAQPVTPTAEATTNPLIREERNTAGEMRAEELAPPAPQNPLIREEQAAEEERAEPSNPLLDTVQPKAVAERNTTGEERAEAQAPEAPQNPFFTNKKPTDSQIELDADAPRETQFTSRLLLAGVDIEKLVNSEGGSDLLSFMNDAAAHNSISGVDDSAAAEAAANVLVKILQSRKNPTTGQLTQMIKEEASRLSSQQATATETAPSQNTAETASTEPAANSGENTSATPQNTVQTPSRQLNSNTEVAEETAPQNSTPTPPTPPENPTDNLGTKEVQTQSVVHDVLTEEEKARPELNPENDTHVQHSDELVHQQARQTVDADPAKARSDLMNTEDEKMWTDVQVETANIIIQEEIDRIRAMQPGAEQDAAYAELAKFKDKYNKQGTDAARSLRMRQNLNSSSDIISEASTILYGEEDQSKLRKMTPEKKAEIMQQVSKGTEKLDSIIEHHDTQSLIDTIKEYAGIRNTRGFLDTKNKALDRVLNEVLSQEGGEEFLQNILRTQISSVASDYINPGAVNKLKAYKFLAALSNLQTASNNVGANTVFGSFMDAVSSNASIAGDAFMSLFTGKRTVGFERLSKAGIKGGYDAGLRSWLEVSLDADTESSSTKYEEFKGRTFKANSNSFFERMLAAWERNIAYQMETTDQVAKGSIAAETERSLEKITDSKTAEETGKNEALYRSLQEDNAITKATLRVRDLLNKVAHIGNEQTGTYGLGDFLLMFAKVPANAVKTQLDINPVMIPKHLYDAVEVMAKGKNATFAEQRSAAKALGQSVNGVALVALATVLSAKGVIDYTEPDDKDEKALYDAEGKTGLQINLSALKRWISGDDTAWSQDDNLISLGWLPQLNSILIIGNMIYKDSLEYGDDTTAFEKIKDAGINSISGMLKSLSEFPAVSTISGMINAGKYADVDPEASKKEQNIQRAGAVVADALGDLASGFTPNALAATAKGLDPYERSTNNGGGAIQQAIDTFKSKIPGLREDLPKRYDGYGNPLKSDNPLLDFLDSTTIPGDVDKYNPYAHDEELSRIGEANGKSYFPDRNAPNSIKLGDGAELELDSAQKETWIQTEGESLSKMQDEFFASDYYDALSDESKGAVLDTIEKYSKYLANQSVSSDADVDFKNKEFDGLLGGVDTYGTANDKTPLKEESIVPYYAFKYGLKDLTGKVEGGDPTAYSAIDSMIKDYAGLDDNLKTVLAERCDEQNLEKLLLYDDLGIGSQSYYTVKNSITDVTHEHDKSGNASGSESLEGLIRADIPESEKRTLIENYEETGVVNKTQYQSYNAMKDYGVSLEDLYDFGEEIKYRTVKETGEVKVKTSNFDAASAAYAISQIPGLTDEQRNDIYNSLKGEWSNYYNDWKNYTYQSEIDYINSDRCKYIYGKPEDYDPDAPQVESSGTTYKSGGKGGGGYRRRGGGYGGGSTKSETINKQLTKLLQQGTAQNTAKIKNRSYAPSLKNSKSSSYDYFKQNIKK